MKRSRNLLIIFLTMIVFINPLLTNYLVGMYQWGFLSTIIILNLILGLLCMALYEYQKKDEQKKIKTTLNMIIEGDFGQRFEVNQNSSYYFITNKLNEILSNLRSLFEQVIGSSVHTAEKAENLQKNVKDIFGMTTDIANAINEVAEGAETQAVKLDETEKAFQKIYDYISKTNNDTEKVASASEKATNIAHKGDQLVNELIDESKRNNQMVTKTMHNIEELTERSKEVTDIVNIITGIAKQTNLLALNASIEAARAGAEGQSFGVVANQIRDLAQEVDSSAKQISELLENVNSLVVSIHNQMKENVVIIEQQTTNTIQVGEMIKNVNQIVSNNFTLMHELNQASEEAAVVINQSEGTLNTILSIAETNAASGEEVASSVDNQCEFLSEIDEMSNVLYKDSVDSEMLLTSKIMDKTMINLCRRIRDIEEDEAFTKDLLEKIKQETAIDDIFITNDSGEFTLTTIDEILGENLFEINEWAAKLDLSDLNDSVITPMHRRIEDNRLFKFAMIPRINGKGIVEIGLALESLSKI